ncbi:MAG: HEAT repeat domain-containing protein [Planctomycetota bacterium]|nr:HEAT repeat domain-containing protein [Planctomycetota bacterium]
MARQTKTFGFACSVSLLVTLAGTCASFAQPASTSAVAPAQAASPREMLQDFIHYVRIDRRDLAASFAQSLIASGISNKDFYRLVQTSGEEGRFTDAVSKAAGDPALEPVAAQLFRLFDTGRLAMARDPEQIAENIRLLTTTQRGNLMGRQGLIQAGEYAIPELLRALTQDTNLSLRAEAQDVLSSMSRQALVPLTTALPYLPPEQQARVVNVLGSLGTRMVLPFILDLATTTDSQSVREACQRILARESLPAGVSAGSLYAELAAHYLEERTDLTSFRQASGEAESHQLLWSYTPQQGLFPQAIRTEVFHEAMAMRHAERALTLDSDLRPALATWISANFSREVQTPEQYENPGYGADRRPAMYYAVAGGPEVCQLVLGDALDRRNTPVARLALAAVEQTAGGSSLWTSALDQGATPLIQALTYPNRRVQYEAALALAAAQPRQTFPGAERVVPTLAGAIREAARTIAVVIARDTESYQSVRRLLESANFEVLPFARSLPELAAPLAEAPGIDLIVSLNLTSDANESLFETSRGTPKLVATPMLALTDAEGYRQLRPRYSNNPAFAVRPAGTPEDQLRVAIDQLLNAASGGPINAEEAAAYSTRSLTALRELAIANNTVLNVSDAALALIASLSSTEGATRVQVAQVLSRIDESQAQSALMDAAFNAEGSDQIELMGEVAASAKRFGNRLQQRQVTRLIDLVRSAEGDQATAAASLMGALNLPNTDVIPLILNTPRTASR